MAKTSYQVAGQIFQAEGGAASISRGYKTVSLTIGSALAETEEFDATGFPGGMVHLAGTVWTAANIGFKVSPTSGGSFAILYDYLGAPVQISGVGTAISGAYQIPDEFFPAGFVKLWSKSTTAATITDTNQGDARAITVVLKG